MYKFPVGRGAVDQFSQIREKNVRVLPLFLLKNYYDIKYCSVNRIFFLNDNVEYNSKVLYFKLQKKIINVK